MKALSNVLGLLSLIVFFGYIFFNEGRHYSSPTTISDEEVASPQFRIEDGPLPAVSFDIPTNISFAGEEVPLDLPDVKERLDKELQSNTYFHSNTIFLIKRAN